MTIPRISVVVPAHQASSDLARCIEALLASDLPKPLWELIIVDDGSESHAVTRTSERADQIVSLPAPSAGPAHARNEGAAVARGEVVAFVDADVLVHRDALRLLAARLDEASVSAVFGSYDDTPEHPGLVSQYRNLLHHRVHQQSGGDVESFWAGLGAVRRSVFNSVGGFDDVSYRRPEMEDVELGYRLRDAGHRIVLDPQVQGTHLKRWTLGGMLASDFTRRGLPWARLLVRRNMLLSPRGLSLGASERVSALLATGALATGVLAALTTSKTVAMLGVLLLSLFVLANMPLLSWLSAKRGVSFAVLAIPLHLAYSVNAVTSLVAGAIAATVSRRSEQERYTRRQ